MATKTTLRSGAWDEAIWDPAGTPSIDDDVIIAAGHAVHSPVASVPMRFSSLTINGTFCPSCSIVVGDGGAITIGPAGQLYSPDGLPYQHAISSTGTFQFTLRRTYPDTRRIDLGGYRFDGIAPSLGCVGDEGPYPAVDMLRFNEVASGDWWLTDPGLPQTGAELVEQGNEGAGENYARWSKGKTRSLRVSLRWPKLAGASPPYVYDYGEMLRRYVQSPYTVLLATPSVLLRGHIESVVYQGGADGGRHHRATVTLVEGCDE